MVFPAANILGVLMAGASYGMIIVFAVGGEVSSRVCISNNGSVSKHFSATSIFFVKTSPEDIPMELNSVVTAFIKDSFLIIPVTLHAAAPIAALIAVSLPMTERLIPVASIRARRPLLLKFSIKAAG